MRIIYSLFNKYPMYNVLWIGYYVEILSATEYVLEFFDRDCRTKTSKCANITGTNGTENIMLNDWQFSNSLFHLKNTRRWILLRCLFCSSINHLSYKNIEHLYLTFVEPFPPGPIDKNASNFHPENLHLKWTAPGNRTYVDRYSIIVDGHTYRSSSDEKSISRRLKPGRNYTVTMVAKSWFSHPFGRTSKPYVEEITTLRKCWHSLYFHQCTWCNWKLKVCDTLSW